VAEWGDWDVWAFKARCFGRGFEEWVGVRAAVELAFDLAAHFFYTLSLGEKRGACVATVRIYLHSTGHHTCFPNSELRARLEVRFCKMDDWGKSGRFEIIGW